MVKVKTEYVCQNCGSLNSKWQGQCPDCLSWNTLIEQLAMKKNTQSLSHKGYAGSVSLVKTLSDVELAHVSRFSSGFTEFDHVLGGGIVPGAVTLIGGDPGIGKSSILLQMASAISKTHQVLYITGEESPHQVALRAHRMNLERDRVKLMAETNIESIIHVFEEHKPDVMIIDSIQTMATEMLQSAPGGVAQVRESTAILTRLAKEKNCAIFLIGHVTKTGEVAGPRVLEHIVDVVVLIEGQNDGRYRVMRAVKNRFGAINELGVFAMTDKGMKQVKNPSAIFLSRTEEEISGSVIMSVWEGSRPLLVEVQVLVDENSFGNPRRVTVGLDYNRISILIAVLHKHVSLMLGNYDVFVNVVGGVKVTETSSDLALIVAIISSYKNKPIPENWLIFGEVGLSGEIRPVSHGQDRIIEAKKHGFKTAVIPYSNKPTKTIEGMKIMPVKHVRELTDLF
ncbi:DNA repair protein RadA [Thiotrichales bacterium 19S3-7]|nr:DNA repair protein RadA [Thiotrichales bacterium 19S3-7]MCF6802514.1 DNA repair protein RadA [Thiotrichales bacterium 19S3-11]